MSIIAAYRSPPRASIFTHETHGQGEPAMSKPKLAIVIGTIRPNRFGGHAAQWNEEIARRRTEEASPLYAPSKNEVAQRWHKKVGEFDDFIFTAAEYNRGPTAALKNALDYAYAEWGNKPIAFVGYGGVRVICNLMAQI